MKLDEIHSAYFIGIGGIGMSAIARWFNQRGATVAGYDRVSTVLTQTLEQEGISIHYEDDVTAIPDWATDPKGSLIVYTPAIPEDHRGWNFLENMGLNLYKRSEVLGIISKDHYTLAIAGTHGKTTTSSMLAHTLNGSEKGCSAFVGGIMTNYQSNLIIGDADAPVVVEADEFDRSFMSLRPDFTVVTSIDPDHLDIYGDPSEMQDTYMSFIQLTDADGKIILHEQVANQVQDQLARAFSSYGLESASILATNIRVEGNRFVFDYEGGEVIRDIQLKLPGFHNVLNATAAITAALHVGMSAIQVKSQIETYEGVKRRFEYIVDQPKFIYIDDYAHHPSEIEALMASVKKLYPGKKITAVFQPHLFSRTNDFHKGFAESLSSADAVLLLDIYPAREQPIKGVSSEMIHWLVTAPKKWMVTKEELLSVLDGIETDVLLTIGAGDIDTMVPKIKSYYEAKLVI